MAVSACAGLVPPLRFPHRAHRRKCSEQTLTAKATSKPKPTTQKKFKIQNLKFKNSKFKTKFLKQRRAPVHRVPRMDGVLRRGAAPQAAAVRRPRGGAAARVLGRARAPPRQGVLGGVVRVRAGELERKRG